MRRPGRAHALDSQLSGGLMSGHPPATRGARALLCLAALLGAVAAYAAHPPEQLTLPAGTRVGVVNLLDAEVTHFHAARQVQDSFLKTYSMDWPVAALLMASVSEPLKALGLSALAVEPGEALSRA